MPKVSLRLTVEEHELLRRWAFEGRRSLQRELIYRLFAGNGGLGEAGGGGTGAEPLPADEPVVVSAAAASPSSSFRGPDLKGGRKR